MMEEDDDAPSEPTLRRDNESEYSATWLGNEAGSLTLYWDEASETYWINNIETEPPYRRRGIATALLRMAIAEHGIVYASTQPSAEDTATDTRHLEPDGLALVTRLIRRGLRGLVLLHPRDAPVHALPAPPLEHGQRLITQYFQPPPGF
jgi:GNAT superfamily N-acetyltransferase